MLSQRYQPDTLNLISKIDWHPYATAEERPFWQSLPESTRQAYIRRGEIAQGYDWPSLKATLFLEVARIGNRYNYQQMYFERRSKVLDLVLAECMEGQGRFVDAAVNGIWLLCEESYWGIPAHLYAQRAGVGLPDTAEPTVDLFAAETASLLAYALYLIGAQLDTVSPLIRPRIEREIDLRILTPNLERDDFWWMGFADPDHRPNNWNPWIHSNWLTCVLLVEPDDTRRRAAVGKIMHSLDKFIDPYPTDGGCDEGPSYWGRAAASMYDCLELLDRATSGQIDVWEEPVVQAMGQFIYRAHIAGDYVVNFADAPGILRPEAGLIYGYGKRIHDPDMMAMGVWEAHRQNILNPDTGPDTDGNRPNKSAGRELALLVSLAEMAEAESYAPLPRDVWLPVIEDMFARDQARATDGFYVAAKGGHNAESHNHNDIGQFVAFIDGLPVLVDAGVETYSVKTFSPQRYEIWTMQSAYHNLPTINGIMQAPGEEYAARDAHYQADDQRAVLSLDIAGAYPPEAGLRTWRRTVRLERGQGITVEDAYALNSPPKTLTLSLLTPCAVDATAAGVLRLNPRAITEGRESGSATITYKASKFSAAVEPIIIDDIQLRGVWGEQLCRIVLTAVQPAQQDTWTLTITR
ncbi:MAG: heparinase II/III-family protein [Anaerolineae bacterium]|nr:heparinase II/III-family protein [Anaerolineae bacterium]